MRNNFKNHYKHILTKLLLINLIVISIKVLSSCTATNKIIIQVDAYGNDTYLKSKRYLLVFADSMEMRMNKLQYLELSKYVRITLQNKGYIETTNPEEADVVVFFNYGISDPKTFQRTFLVPVWGQTGTTSYTTGNIYGNTYRENLSINYNQTTRTTPTYGVTGTQNVTKSVTVYLRYLKLSAYDFNDYKKNGNEAVIWNMNITSTGSSGDLRSVFPYLVFAGQDFYGKSSGEMKTIKLYVGDDRVNKLKSSTALKPIEKTIDNKSKNKTDSTEYDDIYYKPGNN